MLCPEEDTERRIERACRFMQDFKHTDTPKRFAANRLDSEFTSTGTGPVAGKSRQVEREYLRLTAQPSPENVRPLAVLRKSLKLVKQKWVAENNYQKAWTQLKSIRQDCTVQHLKNDFVVEVYETHGRIALEQGDLSEFSQCLGQLEGLYEEGFQGHKYEFFAYKILTSFVKGMAVGKPWSDLNMVSFIQKIKLNGIGSDSPVLEHAFDTCNAVLTQNWIRFFRLFEVAPLMSGYILGVPVPLVDWQFRVFGVLTHAVGHTYPMPLSHIQLPPSLLP